MSDVIEELLNLEDIEECEDIYLKKNGYPPFNISTWNPSEYFANNFILNKVRLADFSYINYLYSYELDDYFIKQVTQKLGAKDTDAFVFTNSGTSSINLVVTCLQNMNVKRIIILSPSYFTIFYNCIQSNIHFIELSLKRDDTGYRLPVDEIEKNIKNVDAIWITNPVYNTSVYYSDEDINYLYNNVLNKKLLVVDECFCLCGNELLRHFHSNKNFIGIYDPMKQVLLNGIKFSAIIFSDIYRNLFARWSDVICGSLAYSTLQAMDLFIKEEFNLLANNLHLKNNDLFENIKSLMVSSESVHFDQNVKGHMLMGYCKEISYDHLQDKEAILNFMNETGTCIIPGNRFHFPKNLGLTFRINLARDCTEFRSALINILSYMEKHTKNR